jgi:threonine synthase
MKQNTKFSLVQGLRCINCGREEPPEYFLECPECESLMDLVYETPKEKMVRDDAYQGMWKYHSVLPIRKVDDVVSLGEGSTPLLRATKLAKRLGVRELWLKYEGTNPTGTVKDRTSSTAVSSAKQFGFQSISVVSTGNAGVSIANYARSGGLKSAIFCYERADPLKMHHMGLMATKLITYSGEYDHIIEHFDRVMARKIGFDGGARRNPYKHEGKKTISYEVVDQSGRAPDYFYSQTSGCEIFTASYRGFQEMVAWGVIETMPILVCVQSAMANPIVRAFKNGGPVVPIVAGPTIAKGMAAGNSGPKGDRVLEILRAHGGHAVEVEDEEVLQAQRLLVEEEGLWSGPTGAVAVAALCRDIKAGDVDPEKTFLCLVTETGLTSPYPPFRTTEITSTLEAVEGVFADL